MILNYFSLGVLVFVFIVIFYGIIIVHDIPYMLAKNRNHPHADAIHVAGWVSLFTLHIIWPILWIWATLYNPERGWGMSEKNKQEYYDIKLQALKSRIDHIEHRMSNVSNVSIQKNHERSK
ncbi:DUF3302 domain-containing protein [Lelliottia amnigena]|uniref:DUF3302 domain-containing protein n=1 Tax=Lelliottia TaxID=1330545 RepID=UPI00192B5CDF|nr:MULTISPECIES: DUF3302 domain-containing protein [Lelliottia]MBL5885392.1 DUF3302 domain-containing protein [Lelliottia aquatilis]MBL5923987.1 DUF3302 domain-containing protein [Lelliottia amnigena]MBL5932059.1 DUF3302 domain-containing protein [Lelliottia amnigena]